MAKQTFTAGQVLTAAEMNSLQENDYNWTVTTKTASYTLAAGDEGTRIVMNNAGATTITVDDSVFAAGDVVWIHNIGAGTCTITAGTATVSTLGELALEQYAGGQLYFTSASAAIFFPTEQGGGGLVAVKHALFTGTQTNSTAAQGNFAVTDLSITHTLADSANKLIISAYLGQVASTVQRANVGMAVADDGTLIGIGDAASSRTRTAAGGNQTSLNASNGNATSLALTFVYEPGDTASHTYTVRAINPDAGTQTIYINRSEIDADGAGRVRGSSGFVIQEVSA